MDGSQHFFPDMTFRLSCWVMTDQKLVQASWNLTEVGSRGSDIETCSVLPRHALPAIIWYAGCHLIGGATQCGPDKCVQCTMPLCWVRRRGCSILLCWTDQWIAWWPTGLDNLLRFGLLIWTCLLWNDWFICALTKDWFPDTAVHYLMLTKPASICCVCLYLCWQLSVVQLGDPRFLLRNWNKAVCVMALQTAYQTFSIQLCWWPRAKKAFKKY